MVFTFHWIGYGTCLSKQLESFCAPTFFRDTKVIGNSLTSFAQVFGTQSGARIGLTHLQRIGQAEWFPKRSLILAHLLVPPVPCGMLTSGISLTCPPSAAKEPHLIGDVLVQKPLGIMV
jgi:hypothetical protein